MSQFKEGIMHKLGYTFCLGLVVGGVAVSVGPTVTATQDVAETRVINLPGRNVAAPFSDAVLAGNTLYLAGRLGLDPETRRPPATAEQEARNVLDGMQSVLAEADMTMDDLVSVQVFCSDISLYADFNRAYRDYFGDAPPARAFLGSGTLLSGARFEVMGIAVKG